MRTTLSHPRGYKPSGFYEMGPSEDYLQLLRGELEPAEYFKRYKRRMRCLIHKTRGDQPRSS